MWQLDYDASNGVLAAGTHGRGAYTLDHHGAKPALVVSKEDSGVPVGPGSTIHYTITVRNIGNADATGVMVTDPLPTHTKLASVGEGGQLDGDTSGGTDRTVPAGGSISLHFSVVIDQTLPPRCTRSSTTASWSRATRASPPPAARTPRRSRRRTT